MVQKVKKVASGKEVVKHMRSLVNGRGLQLELPRVLHKALFVPAYLYRSETLV